ncbi:MAG: MBL fold metallo-hydrolase [Clostridiales bacterium]|nr:MBL fold metallo-hydrolase [Clostridiales bacterium]
MRFTFCPLFSGSSGNAIFVGAGDTRILIDGGMPGRSIENALREIGILPETLTGIAVTHEHSDHVKGVGILSRKYRIPVYANERTWNAMARTVGEVEPRNRRVFETEEDFYIGDLALLPFSIPHDAADPVGYRVFYGGRSIGTATDMGYMQKKVLKTLAGVDVLLLESNHDPDLLMQNPHYSLYLKQRILSNHGHLSNEASAKALLDLYGTGVRQVLLGHLSGENNTPELALATAAEHLSRAGVALNEDIHLDLAWRDRVSKKFEIE